MSSDIRYAFLPNFLDYVKYTFTPSFQREIKPRPATFSSRNRISAVKLTFLLLLLSLPQGCWLILYRLRRIFRAKYWHYSLKPRVHIYCISSSMSWLIKARVS